MAKIDSFSFPPSWLPFFFLLLLSTPFLSSASNVPSYADDGGEVVLESEPTSFFISSGPSLQLLNVPSYADHCGAVVPESEPTSFFISSGPSLQLLNDHFSGGAKLFHSVLNSSLSPFRAFRFTSNYLRKTQSPTVFQVQAELVLRAALVPPTTHNSIHDSSRSPRAGISIAAKAAFNLSGFWSQTSGDLCMVGDGAFKLPRGIIPLHLSGVLKLNWPKTSTIRTSLVTGTLESFSAANGNTDQFDPIRLVGYAQKSYDFTLLSQAGSSCSSARFEEKSLSFDPASACSYLQTLSGQIFHLDYQSSCTDSSSCTSLAASFGFSLRFMSFGTVRCIEQGKVHLSFEFTNSSEYTYENPIVPGKSLVGEGYWDPETSQLCLAACPTLEQNEQTKSSIGDCAIGLSMIFPAVVTLRSRGEIVGQMWSNKNKNDAGYFSMVSFRSLRRQIQNFQGLSYEYTELDSVAKSCVAVPRSKSSDTKYPAGNSFDNPRRFTISLRDDAGRKGAGSAALLAIGNELYAGGAIGRSHAEFYEDGEDGAIGRSPANGAAMSNVSYAISYRFPSFGQVEQFDIAAEGVYNSAAGTLCMKGCLCRSLALDSMDCQIMINVQFPALNPKVEERVNGSIRSTRNTSNPLFFEPLSLTSSHRYKEQAAESIWRVNVEVALLLTSLTVSCICIRLQISHAKKHKDALTAMSTGMLAILTVSFLIPLAFNFEALFVNKARQYDIMLQNGGWLCVEEVTVRVMAAAALLLSCRLIQLVRTAKSTEMSKGPVVSERSKLKLWLPACLAGALLIAWWLVKESQRQRPAWEAMIVTCARLVLEGFLLPQIVVNCWRNSTEKALTPFFYVGITLARVLPRLYNYSGNRHYSPRIYSGKYASMSTDQGDFDFLPRDAVVVGEGLIFAVLIFLQQRFGGSCFLPRRFRRNFVEYETVPTIGL